MPPTVRTSGLERSFGDVTALDGVDLDVEGPAIIGLAGPNGSGKTTLARCLLGLLAPDAGDVAVDGTDPLAFDASDRARIGYMPQHEAVYRDLTARANVDFFARLYGVDDRATAVRRVLEFVDLADRADDRVATLSGGMVRRTSLACAVVHDPDLLVLDEPTVGLDPELRATMWDGFRQRRDDGALALVVVVPAFVVYLVSEVFPRPEPVTPILLGVFVFVLTYVLTAIGFLRERTEGTLERVLVTPVSRTGLVLGYGVLAAAQSLVLLAAAVVFLDTEFAHGVGPFLVVALLGALSALGLGVLLSLFAETEFQALQFVPAVITPQVILGGTFLPVAELPWYLEYPARAMPVTYLIEAMEYVVADAGTAADFRVAVAALALFTVAAVVVCARVVGRGR